jgi:ribonuclease HI
MDNDTFNAEIINIFSDGGARGNPGPAAIGFLIKDNQLKLIQKGSEFIGNATNNVAEYKAVIAALASLQTLSNLNSINRINFNVDSLLVAKQLMMQYKIKNNNLVILFNQVKYYENKLGFNILANNDNNLFKNKIIKYQYIPREQNKEADSLVNLVLDSFLQ